MLEKFRANVLKMQIIAHFGKDWELVAAQAVTGLFGGRGIFQRNNRALMRNSIPVVIFKVSYW